VHQGKQRKRSPASLSLILCSAEGTKKIQDKNDWLLAPVFFAVEDINIVASFVFKLEREALNRNLWERKAQ